MTGEALRRRFFSMILSHAIAITWRPALVSKFREQTSRSRPFWFTKLRLCPLFHSRELRGELRLQAIIASHAAQPRSPDAKFALSIHAQLSAGVRAIETKAKISGLMTQKIELAI